MLPSPASTVRGRPTSLRCQAQGLWFRVKGIQAGVMAIVPRTRVGKKSEYQSVIHGWGCEEREAQGSRSWVTSLELRLLPRMADPASVPPPHLLPLSLPLRVVSTGASRMVSWTPVTPATSPKASRAFRTMWMQPWPSPLPATVNGSGSTSSRVLRGWRKSEQAVELSHFFSSYSTRDRFR